MTLPPRLTIPLAEWIDTAAPGDSVIVQTSPHNGNREVADARDAGLITTAQKRAGGAFHLIAIRTKGKVKPDKRPLGRGMAGSERIGRQRVEKEPNTREHPPEMFKAVSDMLRDRVSVANIARELRITYSSAKYLAAKVREERL
jgi:hypothetical protein